MCVCARACACVRVLDKYMIGVSYVLHECRTYSDTGLTSSYRV